MCVWRDYDYVITKTHFQHCWLADQWMSTPRPLHTTQELALVLSLLLAWTIYWHSRCSTSIWIPQHSCKVDAPRHNTDSLFLLEFDPIIKNTMREHKAMFYRYAYQRTMRLADEGIINTFGLRQNGRRFPDDIFKCIFLKENVWILIKISLKFVHKGPINDIPSLVQIMAWRRQAASHYLNQWWLVYWRIYASLGLNEKRVPRKCVAG